MRKLILWLVDRYFKSVFQKKRKSSYIAPSNSSLDSRDLAALVDCSLDLWLTTGPYSTRFKKELGNFLSCINPPLITLTNSGSSANLVALASLFSHKLGDRRLRLGNEVITVACAFPTTVFPIIQLGLIPVFVDIEKRNLNINVAQIEDAITPQTKVIFVANTLGNPANWTRIREIADKHKLWVIADCCDSLASSYRGQRCGTLGDLNTFSFFPAHEMTGGELGAVATRSELLHHILESYVSWGRDCYCKPGQNNMCGMRFSHKHGRLPLGYDHKYIFSHLGYNLKPTEFQAALAVSQIEKMGQFSKLRRVHYEFLWRTLKQYEEHLILPYKYDVESDPVWFGFPVIFKKCSPFNKKDMVKYLEEHGVGTREIFAGNILRHPVFTENDFFVKIRKTDMKNTRVLDESDYALLPESEWVMEHGFWIGCHHALTMDEVKHMAKVIREYFDQ